MTDDLSAAREGWVYVDMLVKERYPRAYAYVVALEAALAQRDEMLAKVREECDEARRIGRWVPLWRIIAILDAGEDK